MRKYIFLSVFILLSCSFFNGLDFTVLFDDVNGFKEGDKVICHGFQIGKITNIDLDEYGRIAFKMRVDGDYRKMVKTKCLFVLHTPMFKSSGDRYVEMKIPADPGVQIEPGAVLAGEGTSWEFLARHGLKMLKEFSVILTAETKDFLDELEEFSKSEQAKELLKQITELAQTAAKAGKQGLEITGDRMKELTKEMQQLYDQLEKEGKLDDAKKLKKKFKKFLESQRGK